MMAKERKGGCFLSRALFLIVLGMSLLNKRRVGALVPFLLPTDDALGPPQAASRASVELSGWRVSDSCLTVGFIPVTLTSHLSSWDISPFTSLIQGRM